MDLSAVLGRNVAINRTWKPSGPLLDVIADERAEAAREGVTFKAITLNPYDMACAIPNVELLKEGVGVQIGDMAVIPRPWVQEGTLELIGCRGYDTICVGRAFDVKSSFKQIVAGVRGGLEKSEPERTQADY